MVIIQKHYVIQKTKELQVFQGETRKIRTQTVRKNRIEENVPLLITDVHVQIENIHQYLRKNNENYPGISFQKL